MNTLLDEIIESQIRGKLESYHTDVAIQSMKHEVLRRLVAMALATITEDQLNEIGWDSDTEDDES